MEEPAPLEDAAPNDSFSSGESGDDASDGDSNYSQDDSGDDCSDAEHEPRDEIAHGHDDENAIPHHEATMESDIDFESGCESEHDSVDDDPSRFQALSNEEKLARFWKRYVVKRDFHNPMLVPASSQAGEPGDHDMDADLAEVPSPDMDTDLLGEPPSPPASPNHAEVPPDSQESHLDDSLDPDLAEVPTPPPADDEDLSSTATLDSLWSRMPGNKGYIHPDISSSDESATTLVLNPYPFPRWKPPAANVHPANPRTTPGDDIGEEEGLDGEPMGPTPEPSLSLQEGLSNPKAEDFVDEEPAVNPKGEPYMASDDDSESSFDEEVVGPDEFARAMGEASLKAQQDAIDGAPSSSKVTMLTPTCDRPNFWGFPLVDTPPKVEVSQLLLQV